MQNCFKILEWDSNFFNLKIAEINKGFLLEENQDLCFKELAAANVEVAYYSSDHPLEEELKNKYHFHLVSKKVPIKKQLLLSSPLHNNISFYNDPEPNEDLISLAHRAGDFSRFFSDPYIDVKKVRELYKIWITKSVQKKMASEVLVYKEKGRIKGFVTLIADPPHGQTPLFAVSRDAEGKGISFSLMRAADAVLYEKGCSFYTSATQADNRAAVTVFKRHGFEIGAVEYVYHLWKK